jgi:predicted Zn-ribbon and HTH transcriptional regulator
VTRNDKEYPMNGEPCEFCGYAFDQDKLGRYGCPNCEGAAGVALGDKPVTEGRDV